jgi:DNA-binding SARP family transcriptional activator
MNQDETPPAAATIHLRLLAVPALLRGDGRQAALERKDAALLALLALDGPTPRARAAALLWPDAEPRKARNSLRQRLFRLHRAAGSGIVVDSVALALADGVDHDLASLHTQLAGDPAAAGGELLGSFGYEDCTELEEWVRGARERFRVRRRDALAAIASQEESAGHVARALAYAERLVADEPLSEQAHRLLMRLHYRRGDRSAALAAFARCADRLQAELASAPGAETQELAQLIERTGDLPGSATRRLPTALTRPPVLVGRERQWRALDEAWDQGRIAILVADAGMGKTRLLADFARHRGVPLVAARPGDERVPYALLARLLRAVIAPGGAAVPLPDTARRELARLLPELGGAPPEALNEMRLRQAVAMTLAAKGETVLAGLVLDDLHFADAASLELLPGLASPDLRWAMAVRGAEIPAALAGWRRAESGTALVEVPLPPLDETDIRQLLEALALEGFDAAALAGPLARHSGGNPYFVLETLAAMVSQPASDAVRLPTAPTVGALIERRLGQLGAAAQRLARVAALAGIDFDAALAAEVLQSHPLDLADAWSELEAANVLRGDAFAHDLVRDVAARAVPAPIARLLHRGIAAHLEAQAAPPARVAQHFAEAGLWQPAAEFHLRAADAARRASRRTEEVEQRESAIACFDRAGAADAAFDARCAGIESLILVRGVGPAQAAIEGMLAAARTEAQRAAALVARASAALMAADHRTGVASAREALALADSLRQPWLRFDAARLLAVGLSQQGATAEAEALLLPLQPMVEAEGSSEQRGHYWSDLAYVLNSARRLRRTAEALSQAIDCARRLGDLAELAMLTTNLATVYGNLGRIDQAYEHALRARSLLAEIGRAGGPTGGVIEAHVGLYGSGRGFYAGALAAFDRALDCFRGDGQALWIAVCSNNLATTLIDLGQFARARRTLAYEAPSVSHVAARGALLAARIDRLLGASPAVELARAADLLQRGGDFYMSALLDLERAATLPAVAALQLCEATAGAAEGREYGGIATKARLLAARATLEAGDRKAAGRRWSELQATLQTLQPADCYVLEPAAIGIEILAANGDGTAADAVLAAALGWLRQSALPQVPDAFRESFLQRNPVNRALLAAESRRR